jgi:hypothetical protein
MESLETIRVVNWLHPSAGPYDLIFLTGGMFYESLAFVLMLSVIIN